MIAAGAALDDAALRQRGLDLLAWLLEFETGDGHLSPTPVGGRGPEDARPGFDQQPIEAHAMVRRGASLGVNNVVHPFAVLGGGPGAGQQQSTRDDHRARVIGVRLDAFGAVLLIRVEGTASRYVARQ